MPTRRPAASIARRIRVALLGLAVGVVGAALGGVALPRAAAAANSFDAALFTLLNQDRVQNGLPALAFNTQIAGIAEATPYSGCGYPISGRAVDMVNRNYFAHVLPGCGTQNVFNILKADGVPYSWAGENIAWEAGITDPTQAAAYVNTMFMNSPEHRANILNSNFTAVGIGSVTTGPGQTYQGQSNAVIAVEDFSNTPTSGPTSLAPTLTSSGSTTLLQASANSPRVDPGVGSGVPVSGGRATREAKAILPAQAAAVVHPTVAAPSATAPVVATAAASPTAAAAPPPQVAAPLAAAAPCWAAAVLGQARCS